jgi:methyl-accepting chemotaxis protein
MTTRIATTRVSGSTLAAAEAIDRDLRAKLGGQSPALLMMFASTAQPLAELAKALAGRFPGAAVLGASTAGEFTEKGDAKGSTAAFALAGDYKVFSGMGTRLKESAEVAVAQALEGLPRELHGYPHCTAILLLDPLAGNGEESTLIAASLLGEGVRLAGGAAGDDLRMKETFVACGERAASDALVVALVFSKAPLGLGVCHGHEPLSRPIKVTRAAGNVVTELDGKPAWEVWLAETRAHAAKHGIDVTALTKETEGAFLLRYEAGLAAGAAYKIRAPLARDEAGAISFASGIPEGSVIRITESVPERQVASAREAARLARVGLRGRAPAGAVVFDCICRNLILGDDFARAVRDMSQELGDAPIAGFETYGEIALSAGDMSGFHNTTSVVLAFPQDE